MTVYSILLVIVTLTCLALSLWYARKLGDMLSKMAKHAQKLQVKSVELSAEKKRADTLLCQMLPREVAEQLKMDKEVKAEQTKVKVKHLNNQRSCPRTERSRPSSSTVSQSSSVISFNSLTSQLAAVPWKSSTCSTLCTGRLHFNELF